MVYDRDTNILVDGYYTGSISEDGTEEIRVCTAFKPKLGEQFVDKRLKKFPNKVEQESAWISIYFFIILIL